MRSVSLDSWKSCLLLHKQGFTSWLVIHYICFQSPDLRHELSFRPMEEVTFGQHQADHFQEAPLVSAQVRCPASPHWYRGWLVYCCILKYLLNEQMNWTPDTECIFFFSVSLTRKGWFNRTHGAFAKCTSAPWVLFWLKIELQFSYWNSFLKECQGTENLGSDTGKIKVKRVSKRGVSKATKKQNQNLKRKQIVLCNLKWTLCIFTNHWNHSLARFKFVSVVPLALGGLWLLPQNLRFSESTDTSLWLNVQGRDMLPEVRCRYYKVAFQF